MFSRKEPKLAVVDNDPQLAVDAAEAALNDAVAREMAKRRAGIAMSTRLERIREELEELDEFDARADRLRAEGRDLAEKIERAAAELDDLLAERHRAREALAAAFKPIFAAADGGVIEAVAAAARLVDARAALLDRARAALGEDAVVMFNYCAFAGILTGQHAAPWAAEKRAALETLPARRLPPMRTATAPAWAPRRRRAAAPQQQQQGAGASGAPTRPAAPVVPIAIASVPEEAPRPRPAPREQRRDPPPGAGEVQVQILRPGVELPDGLQAAVGDRVNMAAEVARQLVIAAGADYVQSMESAGAAK